MNRFALTIFVLLLMIIPAAAQSGEAISISDSWNITFSGDEVKSPPSFASSGSVSVPLKAGADMTGGKEVLWMKNSFTVRESGQVLRKIYMGDVPGVVRVFINGSEIGIIGRDRPELFYHNPTPIHFFIPQDLLNGPGQSNEIVIRVFNDAASFSLSTVQIGGATAFDRPLMKKDIINNQLYLAFALSALIISLFYLLQYFMSRSELFKLFYGLTNFFLAIYFYDIGAQHPVFPFFLQTLLAKMSFPLFFGALTLFFVEFFSIFNNRNVKIGIIAFSSVLALSLPLLSRSVGQLLKYFNMVTPLSELLLILIVVITVKALIKRDIYAYPISIGVFIAISLSSLDIAAVARGIRPEVWFQGIGIFGFNISMFVAMAIKDRMIQKSLTELNESNRLQSQKLSELFEQIRHMSGAVSEISSDLNRSVQDTSLSVNEMSEGTGVIGESVREQFESVELTNATVSHMISSFSSVSDDVEDQFSSIQNISGTISQMLANFDLIAGNLKEVVEFSNSLASITEKGEEAIKQSDKAIAKVQETSSMIYSIVETVNDIAERTNLLAMNAAIEAAHAGQAGRGFAVVAQEVKKLSENSSRNADQIRQHMDNIRESIDAEVQVNDHTHGILKEINSRALATVEKISGVYGATAEQQAAGGDIQNSLRSIRDRSEQVKKSASEQASKGHEVLTNMSTLVDLSEKVKDQSDSIRNHTEKIVRTMSNIKELSEKSSASSSDLAKSLE